MRSQSFYSVGVAPASGLHVVSDTRATPSVSVRTYIGTVGPRIGSNYLDARFFSGMDVDGQKAYLTYPFGFARLTHVDGCS